jgi:hypothetical protein
MGYWDAADTGAPPDVAGPCPRCAGPVSQDGRRWACEMPGCEWGVWGEVAGVTLTQADVHALLTEGVTPERPFTSKAGKRFTAQLRLDPENDTHLIFVFPERATPTALEGVACPRDGHPIVVRDTAYTCSRPKDEQGQWCPVMIWREVAGHAVTPDEARALLQGETIGPVKCRAKSGTPFRARLRWSVEDGVRLVFDNQEGRE